MHAQAVRDDAGNVVVEAAAGDVDKSAHRGAPAGLPGRPHGGKVTAVDGQQRVADGGPSQLGRRIGHAQPGLVEQDGPRQRVAVGVQAGAGQSPHAVLGPHRAAVDHVFGQDAADDGPGQVELAGGVHAGHLGGLAAQQGAAVLAARLGEAGQHLGQDGLVQARGREVVEEEQRLGALHEDVVDAMVDEILAHGVVAAALGGHRDLGPDAVDAGHEQRLARRGLEQAAEGADLVADPGVPGRAHVVAAAGQGPGGGVDIDPAVGVLHGLPFAGHRDTRPSA